MGRQRRIDPEKLLDAAQEVVARDGAAHLTLDAVAEVAGVSEAAVLYDHKSKRDLIEAVIARAVRLDNQHHEAVTRDLGPQPSPVIRGRIAVARQQPSDEGRAVALNLCAAMAQDAGLRRHMQHNQRNVIAAIHDTSASPRGALLAYLALEGLKLLEYLDFHSWPETERSGLLQDVEWLIDQVPDALKDRP